MANAEQTFMFRTLSQLEGDGVIGPNDTYLILFGGALDASVFEALGYTNWLLSNLNPSTVQTDECQVIDARQLPFADEEFDHVVAHAGLHHTSRPHQAVCEMYRVAKRNVVFFESQDSLLMRIAARLGVASDYEINSNLLLGGQGGVDDSMVPNYIYRWTRREVEKLVRSVDPAREPKLRFFSEWGIRVHLRRLLAMVGFGGLSEPVRERFTDLVIKSLNLLTGGQGNALAVCIGKPDSYQSWIDSSGATLAVKPDLADGHLGFFRSRGDE